MATVKYFIKGKGEATTIYTRLRDGRETDITTSTGYTINPEFWSDKKGEPKQVAGNKDKLNLSNDLRTLKNFIINKLNEDKGTTSIDKDWLNHVVAVYKNPSIDSKEILLMDAIKNYQSELKTKFNPKTGKLISNYTLKNYNTTLMRLEKFEKFKKYQYFLHEVDLTFHSDYKKFATTKLGLSINSIGKDIKQIKTVCLDARDRGYDINKQAESRKFTMQSEPTLFVTLTESEINTIKGHEFKQNYLSNARDWLIIGCWTGCRVGDLMQLDNNNIIHNNKGQKFIRYTQSKTGKQVDLPIHPQVNEVLERLGSFPRPISFVNFNLYIKEVCKLAGLTQLVKGTRQNPSTHKKETGMFEKWELIKSHTCRRSFATNHYNKLSNKLIMRVTGHATEKMLLNYIGETETDHLNDFMNVWDNDKENEVKSIKTA
ncbi:MAG: phage integrase SAM-like domain-containing protein [Crocinitomicaceae bacterium]|nr:phage integrase SAM-like domain-containing protein [Crocinitomicaceae bacterium]